MKTATFAVLLIFAMPAFANLIAYDYEAQFFDNGGTPRTGSGVTGTIVFDTALLGLQKLTANFDAEKLTWKSATAMPLHLTSYGGPHYYLVEAGLFDEQPSDYDLWFLQEVTLSEPASLYAALSNFNRYWTPETVPMISGPGFENGDFLFFNISSPYSVSEPATLSLLALGLAAIGIRRRVTARPR